MGTARRHTSIGFALAITLAALTISPGIAMASSGEITRAEANSDWTLGSIAGAVEWTGCEHWVAYTAYPYYEWGEPYPEYRGAPKPAPPPPYCGWTPYATVGPGSQLSDCNSKDRRLSSLGEGITLVWSGEEHRRFERDFTETAEFDISAIPLSGGTKQLACLALIETAPQPIACIQIVGFYCPPYVMGSYRHEVASAFLAGPLEPPVGSEEPEEPETEEPAEEPEVEEGKEESEESQTEEQEP
jgi:hypothetical protein